MQPSLHDMYTIEFKISVERVLVYVYFPSFPIIIHHKLLPTTEALVREYTNEKLNEERVR